MPGLTGISTALKLGDRVYVIDCGRSSVTQYANAQLGFTNLAGIFITHLHEIALPQVGAKPSAP